MDKLSLTPEEVNFYHQNGYLLHKKQLFSKEKMAGLEQLFEEQLAQKGSKLSDELDTPHFREGRLLEYLLSKEVLDLVEPILGPNIGLWSSHFICKDPYVGRATPWHEDSFYWNKMVDSCSKIVTVWFALDRSTKDNGCMRVISGTHNEHISEYEDADSVKNMFPNQIKNVDESQAVYFELEKGECSLHDARIIHGAVANTSPYRRCGYTMRYFATSIKVYHEKHPNYKIWLARGKDLAGNTYVNT